jgi:hypothetical protein
VRRHAITFTTLNVLVRSVLNELSDHRHGAFRGIGDYGVPAIRKSFELNEVPRQRRCDISLALNRVYRIVLPTQHQSRTPDAA